MEMEMYRGPVQEGQAGGWAPHPRTAAHPCPRGQRRDHRRRQQQRRQAAAGDLTHPVAALADSQGL